MAEKCILHLEQQARDFEAEERVYNRTLEEITKELIAAQGRVALAEEKYEEAESELKAERELLAGYETNRETLVVHIKQAREAKLIAQRLASELAAERPHE